MSVYESIRGLIIGGTTEALERVEPSRLKTTFEEVGPGDWFLPLSIKGVDPHGRIDEALGKGAAGFFAESVGKVSVSALGRSPHIVVSDLRATLFRLAEAMRVAHPRLHVAAVTGSNGKTTVKEMVASIFREAGSAVWTVANLNTKIGIASRLLRLEPTDQRAIFEIGARQREDLIVPLRMTKPDVTGCLNIGEAHLGEFGGAEGLLRTKLSIYQVPGLKACIANVDDARITSAAKQTGVPVIGFGTSQAADVLALYFQFEKERGLTRVGLRVRGQTREAWIPGCQRTHGINAAAAVAFALASGIEDWDVIARGLRRFSPPPQRFQIIPTVDGCVIDDSFNSSPASLKQGLDSLVELYPNASKTLVLGSMLELGEASDALHRECGQYVQKRVAPGCLILIGDGGRLIGEGARGAGLSQNQILHFNDTRALFEGWPSALERSPVVYLKASRAIGLGAIVIKLSASSRDSL